MNDVTKIEDKVRKLIKLAADNPNVNEAAAAMARAQEIATRHALNLDDLTSEEPEEDDGDLADPGPAGRYRVYEWGKATRWIMDLVGSIVTANGARWYYNRRMGMYCVGTKDQADAIRYLAAAMVKEVQRMTRHAVAAYSRSLEENGGRHYGDDTPRQYGASFRLGMAHAIGQRLRRQSDVLDQERRKIAEARRKALAAGDEAAQARGVTALARVERAAVFLEKRDAAIDQVWDSIKWGGRGSMPTGGSRSRSGYSDGRAAGSSMNLGGGGKALGSGD